jgi:signal transduction histidine kinase/ligand-binding sensor domain-containing protein
MSRFCASWLRFAILLLTAGAARDAFALDPAPTLSQYIHRIWQTQQGLPQASIYAIAQTRDGYLWLGTQTGLVKFDGVRFTTIDNLGGVPMINVLVTHLVEDTTGALWIGTSRYGLIRQAHGQVRHFSERDGLPSDSVQCLFADAHDTVWACTPKGIAEITGDTVRVMGVADGLPEPNVVAACEGPADVLFAGTADSRISQRKQGRFVRTPLALPESAAVQAMLCATDGSTWIGTSDGLFHVQDDVLDRVAAADGVSHASVLTLMESRDGAIFAGTNNGFSRIRGYDTDSFRSQDGLSQSTVFSIYEDREGSLWVATKHGLNQFIDGLTIPYTTSEGLPSNSTGPVLQDQNGIIWVGTLGGGLGRYDGHRFTALTTRDGLASDVVYALADDRGGDVWVGTAAGLNRLHNGRVVNAWTTREGLPDNRVRALYRDRSGALWIATGAGPAVLRDGVLRRVDDSRSRTAEPIVAFGQDRDGRRYAAPDSSSPLLHRADTIYEDSAGLLWIGTLGEGLRLLKDGRIFTFSLQDGLFDDVIYGIAADGHGRLWMACSKGIFSVNRDDLLRFAAGTLRRIASTPYSPLDALRTIECEPGVQPVVARMTDGRLWFSTIRGVLVIDPSRLTRHFLPPTVAIDEVTVNGERQQPDAIRLLRADRNNVDFRYTGVSFIAPTRIIFRYFLEGFDKTWVDAGSRREAFYTNLPPGRFQFRVSACNPGGVCAETAQAIAFEIAPQFYRRAWFLPSCAFVAALGGWAMYRLRIRRMKARFDLVLAERGRIARELHDTLIQGFSGITMAMQALASRLPTSSDARTTLEEIVRDAGHSLREARRSITGLRGRPESPSNLAAAVAQAARTLTEARELDLQLTVADEEAELPADVAYNVLRIAQEAILNAVRHSGARTLKVTLERTRDHLRLLVNDDGTGFDHEVGPPRGHYGLIGMRERAAHIGAALELTSQRGRGTTVSLLVET